MKYFRFFCLGRLLFSEKFKAHSQASVFLELISAKKSHMELLK